MVLSFALREHLRTENENQLNKDHTRYVHKSKTVEHHRLMKHFYSPLNTKWPNLFHSFNFFSLCFYFEMKCEKPMHRHDELTLRVAFCCFNTIFIMNLKISMSSRQANQNEVDFHSCVEWQRLMSIEFITFQNQNDEFINMIVATTAHKKEPMHFFSLFSTPLHLARERKKKTNRTKWWHTDWKSWTTTSTATTRDSKCNFIT